MQSVLGIGGKARQVGGVVIAGVMLLSLGTAAMATDYYLSPHGVDTAAGTKSQPWQTLAKIKSVHLGPGDRLLLESGAVFPGSIALDVTEEGTAKHPIVISSTGKLPATIAPSGVTGVTAVGGGITISNLIVKGSARAAGKDDGITFLTSDTKGKKYSDIAINYVEITGVGGDGLSFNSSGRAASGYENVRVTHVNVHDIFGTGISCTGQVGSHIPSYAHKNFTITDCDTSNNHSGTGLVLGSIDHALVEYCHSAGNLGHGGGLAMWAWAAKDVTFRYCIGSGTRTNNGGDGGGFDLDGGCVGCKVIACLSYDNDGPGYMHCDYPTAPPTRDNIITQSIGVNDGRKAKGDSYGFGICNWGSGLDDCMITDNLGIVTAGDYDGTDLGVLWATFIPESSGDLKNNQDVQHVTGCIFTDNTVYVASKGVAYVTDDLPNPTPLNVAYHDNSFQAAPGIAPGFMLAKTPYSTPTAWTAAIAQPGAVARKPSPLLADIDADTADSLCKVTDPHQIPSISLFKALAAQAAARSMPAGSIVN